MKKYHLPKLNYDTAAFGETLSKETFDYHYGKHHQAYLNKVNELIPGTPYEDAPLEEIMVKTEGPIFNNAAQAWNHAFYWNCLTPKSNPQELSEKLSTAINTQFGSLDTFKKEFINAATTNFGSGWTWLSKDHTGKLKISNTSNAANPAREGLIPLLTCDVWEHAYYIDYRNARPKYLDGFWSIINWKYVSEQFEANKVANLTPSMTN
jgi:Fe-Mn family superoxide dismutase